MLRSTLRVDLPSVETERSPGPVEWLRSLFGAELDLRSGKEQLTVGAFSLVEGLVQGFARAGVDDVLSFLVDKKVVYIDTNDVPRDLPLIVQAAEAAGVFERRFREMHLVLAHKDDTLHTLLDCKITSQVLLGEAEMVVELSGRLLELQIRAGESAEAYAERVKAFAAEPDSFEPSRQWLEAFTQRVASSLGQVLVGAKVTHEEASVQLIRPGAQQIRRFDQLGFGAEVESPAYRPVPTPQRAGAYADPFYYYYYDPYYDYMNFILVDAMIHESMWQSPRVMVVDPVGTPLFSGVDAASHAGDGWIGHDAVNYDSAGQLALSDSLSSSSNDDDSSWWDTASSDSSCSSSSSSCSTSSCSSSSCGSSCSSGSSCGSSCSSGSSCGSSSD